MYWAESVSFQCGSCNAKQSYLNPGKHSLHIVVWKAFRDGWYLPTSGQHLCPVCRKKLQAQVQIPTDYIENDKTKDRFKTIDNMPNPPTREA